MDRKLYYHFQILINLNRIIRNLIKIFLSNYLNHLKFKIIKNFKFFTLITFLIYLSYLKHYINLHYNCHLYSKFILSSL